ncbi:peptidase inhibitor 16-like [Anabas testudineus]|uniref:Peptidase inhibitor 16 n=1 Tax=Anabas testudineus TaxID=64144 RepID=A0A7N6FBA3_ANATE|nr:peptidase inhibitor 16-like [Anabas testudineus]
MHQRSCSYLQGVSSQQGASTDRTTRDRASWSSTSRTGSGCHCFCPPRGAPVWAWLLLGALVVPGAWSFLSEEHEELLVELHNHYRGLVSPSAAAMMPLKWDPNLKLVAEGYAAKCIWNHNPDLEDTGENLFAGTGSLDPREAMEKWFLEHLDYDFQNNTCDEDKMCGHYTQMVWADTHRVGCAYHLCNSMEGLEWERVSFLVCNYYPPGNYEGERPYVEGDWCSRCPEKLQKCENNLCVADTEEEEGDEELEGDGTVLPPLATTDVFLLPEEEEKTEEGENVVPPVTTDILPLTTTTTTPSTPSITTSAITTTTTSKPTEQDSEDPQAPATPSLSTHPSNIPSTTTQGKKKMKTTEKKSEGENKQDIEQIIVPNKNSKSAGSVPLLSLPLAGLTGILTLRV